MTALVSTTSPSPNLSVSDRLVLDLVESGSCSLNPEGRWRKLTVGTSRPQDVRPPLEIVEGGPQADVGDRIHWLAVGGECLKDLGQDGHGTQRHHLRLDGDLREVLDGADASGDAAAVSDGDDRLVAEGKRDEDAVDGVLQHRWH